jgi:hypothetical protein
MAMKLLDVAIKTWLISWAGAWLCLVAMMSH